MNIYHLYIFRNSISYYFNKKPTKKQILNLGLKKGYWSSKEDFKDFADFEVSKVKVIDLNVK